MKGRYFSLVIALILGSVMSYGQEPEWRWYNPAEMSTDPVAGRGYWGERENFYDRLPAKVKDDVRGDVWKLGRHAAGEYIRFTSSAATIVVRYAVNGELAMHHMPATGVSGVDLYAKAGNGKWYWASGRYSFGDTIEYRFSNLDQPHRTLEYRLYLPLYNSVKWLTIGVAESETVQFPGKTDQKPIVVYGTSIAQGGCASRPGLGWTNILNRLLDTEIINLAFSGNGRLEPPVNNLIADVHATVFVLDCLPNLVDRNHYPAEELKNRIYTAVKTIRSKHPSTPILLAEHAIALRDANLDSSLIARYAGTNRIFQEALATLMKQGVKNLYSISATEFGIHTESTVDGTHPNDIGMMEYAQAYAKKIREIFKKAK